MKIFYSSHHKLHNPESEIFNGEKITHQEIPDRIENIKKSLLLSGYKITTANASPPLSLLNKVHFGKYLNAFKKLSGKIKNSQYLYPSIFSFQNNHQQNYLNDFTILGLYSFDLYTPIYKKTYQAALSSAGLAYKLAKEITEGKISIGYALCRPPGHHAEKSRMGGYCYLNNAAIAGEYFSKFGEVAILDVDFHHGNGTQQIFYDRADVLTISIHADPRWKFPFYSGFADEKGMNDGENKNINYPLPKGVTNNQYQKILEQAVKKIAEFKPKYLVISLGLDTHKDDPIGGFALTTNYYSVMAKTIKSLRIPTAIIQDRL